MRMGEFGKLQPVVVPTPSEANLSLWRLGFVFYIQAPLKRIMIYKMQQQNMLLGVDASGPF